jgi:hypothetical protein
MCGLLDRTLAFLRRQRSQALLATLLRGAGDGGGETDDSVAMRFRSITIVGAGMLRKLANGCAVPSQPTKASQRRMELTTGNCVLFLFSPDNLVAEEG